MMKRPLNTGIGLMLLLTLVVYLNHFNNAFHFDDFHTIINNANIRTLKNTPRFFTDGSTSSVLPQNQAYRPVTVLSLAIDYWLAGDYYPSYFQTSTFILFLMQGVLMVFLFKKVFDRSFALTPNAYVALIAVTWYMLHPANAETVNYIIARTDVQSTFFVLLGLGMYIFSPFCRKTFLYLIAVGIGALCKPTAIMFAPILFFYILFFEEKIGLTEVFKKGRSKVLWRVIVKTLPSIIFCSAMYLFTDKMTPKTWEPGGTSPWHYLITQPFVILHYFGEFFLPTSLSADTDWRLLPSIWDIRFFAGCAFVIIMLFIAVYTSKKSRLRPVSFGIIWFFLALAPTSSIIPLGEVLNDHRMYFPFIGLVMSVSWAIALLYIKYNSNIKPKFVIPAIVLVLAIYAYGTWQRNIVWHTEESLWHDVTMKSPQNGRGIMNYALALYNKGNYYNAEKYLKRAEKITPEYAAVYTNLGLVKEMEGDDTLAENYYRTGVRLGSNYPDPPIFYARFLIKQWRYTEAIPLLQEAITVSPLDIEARTLLMSVYSMTADWDKLKTLAQQSFRLFPQNPDVMNYLEAAQKKENELDIVDEKIRLHPDYAKFADLSVLNYQFRRYEQCIATAQEAIKLNPQYAGAYNNIGAAYIKLMQYDKAIEALKQALAINPGLPIAKNNLDSAKRELKNQDGKTAGQTAAGYINLSLYYFNNNRYQDCIDACNKALAFKPGYDLAYNNICASYNKLGKYDEAIAAAKRGLQSNPNNELLKNNLAAAIKGKNSKKK
jgi:tetratricopeptide (TPR) repeat protein